jgi:hypothetical protein
MKKDSSFSTCHYENLYIQKPSPSRVCKSPGEAGPSEGALHKEEMKKMAEAQGCSYSLHSATSTKTFFLSNKGTSAWLRGALNGDLVGILDGGAVPYVLWESPSEEDNSPCYQRIGEAYVHAIMNTKR